MPMLAVTRTHARPRRSGRSDVARGRVLTLLVLGLLVACNSAATSSSSAEAPLGPTVTLTNGGCTYGGPPTLSVGSEGLTIPVLNDSDFVAVVTLLRVGSSFDAVAADVNEYNDAESAGEPFELTLDPAVTSEAEVEVDPAGADELAADVAPDTYAVLCLGTPADTDSEGLDEAFLFGPVEITD